MITSGRAQPLSTTGFALALFAIFMTGTASSASQLPQCGKASWYKLTGRTASGEAADPSGMTAAHRTLPFGTEVQVTNLDNGKTVLVRINDRGPFSKGRIIDVTLAAAKQLEFVNKGITRVLVNESSAPLPSGTKDLCR